MKTAEFSNLGAILSAMKDKERSKVRPMEVMINRGNGPGYDSLTCRFPRTSREAFGDHHSPLNSRISFLPRSRPVLWSLAAVLGILAIIVTLGALS